MADDTKPKRPSLWKPILIGSIAGAGTALLVELLKRAWEKPESVEVEEIEEIEDIES